MIWVSIPLIAIVVSVSIARGEASGPWTGLQPQTKALVLYESKTRFGETFPLVNALSEYLGHFDIQVEEMDRSHWSTGCSKGYDYIFYLGHKSAKLPAELLLELSYVSVLFWFEQNIEQYANLKGWPDFKTLGLKNQFVSLHYRGRNLSISPSEELYCAYPTDGNNLVMVDNLHEHVPFAWKKDNIVYISRLDFHNPLNLILASVLEEIIGRDQVEIREVLLRIEDIQPLTSPDTLSELINTLAVARVPYAIALTPTTISNGKVVTLAEYPNLLEVLKTVESNGGCFILKGYEATYENELEYWDANHDKPLEEVKESIALSKISQGIECLAELDLYPVAFEVPGSAISRDGYQILNQHFSTLSGRVQLNDTSASLTLDAPFTFRSKRSGMIVYPENLGYYDPRLLDPAGAILAKAYELSVVPDCSAGLYFHSYIESNNLVPIIEGLRLLDFQFADLRNKNYQVTTPKILIVGQNGHRYINSDIPIISFDHSLRGLRLSLRNWFYVLTVLIVFIIASFIIILSRLRRNKTIIYEQRRL
ncbi:DUF2334 domain-containing protein [Desulfosporosinus sp.]|uniref:DUF2334 domain-containing protein n=1 Tax=Desulfosporosinus sp. TaxID=157907 RepID=UPI0025C0C945|nr:DUF2334 domain-containing protein [Desulfosporosinus sp.]